MGKVFKGQDVTCNTARSSESHSLSEDKAWLQKVKELEVRLKKGPGSNVRWLDPKTKGQTQSCR